ncbi:MAG: T9SS type A sorting domain-containing protein [Bacteroidetes bacterium]|nr:MAG: T9SS type A sorting domain-containing protein [Bacteroidota bacterium]
MHLILYKQRGTAKACAENYNLQYKRMTMKNVFTFKYWFSLICLFSISSLSAQQVLYEGFESGTFPPAGWTTYDLDGDATDNWTSFAGYTRSSDSKPFLPVVGDSVAMSASYTSAATTPDNWLITPQVNIPSAQTELSFYAVSSWGTPAGGTGDFLEVYVSTTGVNPGDFVSIYSNAFDTETWEKVTLSLAAYAGQNVYIAFRHHNCTDQWLLLLDEIVVAGPFVDVSVLGGEIHEYTSRPISQGTQNLNVTVQFMNRGNQTISSVPIETKIYKDQDYNNPIQTLTQTYSNLAAGDTATVNMGTYTVTETGFYEAFTVTNATNDVDPNNDSLQRYYNMTNWTYARDRGLTGTPGLGYGSGTSLVLGQTFEFTQSVVLDSVLFGISPDSVGGVVQVKIFAVSGGVPTGTEIGHSTFIDVNQTVVDFVTQNQRAIFTLDITDLSGNPLTLTPGTYLIGVEESTDAKNMGLLCSSGIVTPGTFFSSFDGGAFQEVVLSNPRTPIIRGYITSSAPVITSSDADNVLCDGETLTLTSSSATGNTWSTGETTQSITVNSAGNYSVMVNGQASNIIAVTVASATKPTVSANGATSFCDGESVVLTSSMATGNTWSSGETTQSITVTAAGNYTVTNVNNGCSATSDVVKVTVNANPAKPTITADGPVAFCSGDQVVLTSSSPTNNSWNNGGSSESITVTSGGSYVVTVTENGCSTDSDPVAVSVTVSPTISIGSTNDPVTCGTTTGSFEVMGTGTGNVTWDGTASGVAPSVTLPYSISGLAAGSYTAYYENANGCRSNTIAISLSDPGAPTKPTISASGSTSFCDGGSVTLTSSASTGITWSTGETTQSITVDASGLYTVTATQAGCSSTSDATEVIENSIPTVSAGNYSAVCSNGAPVFLNAGSPSGGSYSGTGVSGADFLPSNGTQTLTYTYTDGNGCSNSATTTITVNSAPNVSGGSDVAVCDGASVTLNASGADTYSWNNGVSDGQSFVPTSTTTYTVTGTAANGCSNTASVLVTVNSLPNVSAPADYAVCTGESTSLSGQGASTYTWTNGVTNGVIFTPSATNTYVVTGTDINGCQGTDQVTVTINDAPAISTTATNPTTCSGTDGLIIVTGTGTGTISWTGTSSGSASGEALPYTIMGLSAGSYSVEFTSDQGCVSNSVNATLSDPGAPTAPVITADGATAFCEGGSVTLSSSVTTGITWSNGSTDASITVSTSGNYSVTLNENGCMATSDAIAVVVTAKPSITVGTVNSPSSCGAADGSIELTGTGSGTLTWTGVASGSQAGASLPFTVSALGAGSYTFVFNNGCDSDPVSTTISDPGGPATPVISADGPVTLCQGDSVVLTSSETNGITWSTGETTASITVKASGDYSVTAEAGGCSSTSSIATVTVNPLPVISFALVDTVCTDAAAVTLTATPAGGAFSGTGVSGASFDPNGLASGTYDVSYSVTENGCTSTTTEAIVVDSCGSAALADIDFAQVKVYPNPTQGTLMVSGDQLKHVQTISLLDPFGRVVMEEMEVEGTVMEFELSELATGTYFLVLKGEQNQKTIRVQKLK